MKTYYDITCSIRVEASDPDIAIEILKDMLSIGSMSMTQWYHTDWSEQLTEKESNNDTDTNNQ